MQRAKIDSTIEDQKTAYTHFAMSYGADDKQRAALVAEGLSFIKK